jgi:DNA-binding transcriptional MerR regulator
MTDADNGSTGRQIFFKIKDLSELLGIEKHVLRYWEREFPQIEPIKIGQRRNLYTQEHLELFKEIKRLLYEERYTVVGARLRLSKADPDLESFSFIPRAESGPDAEPMSSLEPDDTPDNDDDEEEEKEEEEAEEEEGEEEKENEDEEGEEEGEDDDLNPSLNQSEKIDYTILPPDDEESPAFLRKLGIAGPDDVEPSQAQDEGSGSVLESEREGTSVKAGQDNEPRPESLNELVKELWLIREILARPLDED